MIDSVESFQQVRKTYNVTYLVVLSFASGIYFICWSIGCPLCNELYVTLADG